MNTLAWLQLAIFLALLLALGWRGRSTP